MLISDWSSDVCSSDLVAAGLQADVTLAEQAVGEDPGRGVDRQVLVTVVDVERDHRVELDRVERDVADPADGDAADFHRRHRPQRPDVGEARRELVGVAKSEEHTSELQSLMRISYAVFCLKKKKYHMCIITHNKVIKTTATSQHAIKE